MVEILKLKIIFIISIILFYSCETNPPNEPEQNQVLGKVFISADVDNAEIYIDDFFSNKFTPDTITTQIGEHKISLSKEGYTFNSITVNVNSTVIENVIINSMNQQNLKVILLEDFANVSCDPCVVSNSIINHLDDTYANRVVVVKYSANFPSPVDPFYLSASGENNARMSYYNILFAPTVIIDGIERPVATDENDIRTVIDNRLNEASPFNISAKDSSTSNSYFLNVETTLLDNNFDYSNCKQFVVVVEKEISFSNPPGSNGETEFFHVMRTILPNNSGAELLFNNNGNTINMELYTEIKNEWNVFELTFVVFIQDVETGEIFQAYSPEL